MFISDGFVFMQNRSKFGIGRMFCMQTAFISRQPFFSTLEIMTIFSSFMRQDCRKLLKYYRKQEKEMNEKKNKKNKKHKVAAKWSEKVSMEKATIGAHEMRTTWNQRTKMKRNEEMKSSLYLLILQCLFSLNLVENGTTENNNLIIMLFVLFRLLSWETLLNLSQNIFLFIFFIFSLPILLILYLLQLKYGLYRQPWQRQWHCLFLTLELLDTFFIENSQLHVFIGFIFGVYSGNELWHAQE